MGTSKKKPTTSRASRSFAARFLDWVSGVNKRLTNRYQNFLSRRPHRSFQRTRRRDYARSLRLPGYIEFTHYVTVSLRRRWKTFVWLIVLYATLLVIVGAITSQDTYSQINELLQDSVKNFFSDGINKVGEAGLLAISAFASWPGNLSADQQVYVTLILLLVWLTTVWLHREFLLGRSPRLRDGLYNSGSPIISTILVCCVLLVQFLPVGIMALVYAALNSVALLDGGFGNMMFWSLAVVVATLSLYWSTSTFIALVVVTLPGMYPRSALRSAGDLVVGRRLRILLRVLWAAWIVLLMWAVIIIPVILLDAALKSAWSAIAWIPLVPYMGALLSAGSIVWFASYIYLLYRKVVSDDAKPA